MGLELNLGLNDTADYGLDAVGLGLSNHTESLYLDSQVVAAYANDDYYIGMFGLGSQSINFTDFETSYPTFLSALKQNNMIPSLSWAYTAGAHYDSTGALGSLTLGGYDSSRFVPNNVSFEFAQDVARDLVVSIQSIKASYQNGAVTPFNTSEFPLWTFVDSTVPSLYLPIALCDCFEAEFRLTWNSTSQSYFVNETTHDYLVATNPSITFRLANKETGGDAIDITLRYASFDLVLEYPLIAEDRRYFPLLRAANESQYTLGRTFLQEAYLITDYERSNFSVSQSNYDAATKPNIVTVHPVHDLRVKHNPWAITIGVSFGSIVFATLVLLISFQMWKHKSNLRQLRVPGQKRKPKEANELAVQPCGPKASALQEIDSTSVHGLSRELGGRNMVELQDEAMPSGSGQGIMELSVDRSQPSHSVLNSEIPASFAYGSRSCSKPERTSRTPSSSVEDRLAIFVSTNLIRKSWATINTPGSATDPQVDTVIYSPNTREVNLDQSLPPTPISESVQVSPTMATFHMVNIARKGVETILAQPSIPHYVIGRMGQTTPREQSLKDSIRREHSRWGRSRMEITVPPERSEAEIIRPLTVKRKERERSWNFF